MTEQEKPHHKVDEEYFENLKNRFLLRMKERINGQDLNHADYVMLCAQVMAKVTPIVASVAVTINACDNEEGAKRAAKQLIDGLVVTVNNYIEIAFADMRKKQNATPKY